MANLFENKDRNVIPNFRSFNKTIHLGELDNAFLEKSYFKKDDISELITSFNNNQTAAHAGDLLSAAVVNNIINNSKVEEAANFIIENTDQTTSAQIQIANKVLGRNADPTLPKINRINEFIESNTRSTIQARIGNLKNLNKQGVNNPFVYVELARLYSIIAQKEKAFKNIWIALNLAPNNRYVLRSFARLLTHLGDNEQAHDVIRKSQLISHDPWIVASEIALASLRGRSSKFVKIGREILSSKNFSPFSTSELASAIATLELNSGSIKKSKILFQQSLISPNDNSLAQAEWANNKEHLFEIDLKHYNKSYSYEAFALDSFHNSRWKESIEFAESWFMEMPFTKRPIMFGNHVAAVYQEDHETAIKFCQAGLISNPRDPELINNIAYSYALIGKPSEALKYLNQININEIEQVQSRVCLKATSGLVLYRSNFPELGRSQYLEAMLEAKENNLEFYNWSALLNFTREEIRSGTENVDEAIGLINKLPDKYEEITLQRKRLLEEIRSIRSK